MASSTAHNGHTNSSSPNKMAILLVLAVTRRTKKSHGNISNRKRVCNSEALCFHDIFEHRLNHFRKWAQKVWGNYWSCSVANSIYSMGIWLSKFELPCKKLLCKTETNNTPRWLRTLGCLHVLLPAPTPGTVGLPFSQLRARTGGNFQLVFSQDCDKLLRVILAMKLALQGTKYES